MTALKPCPFCGCKDIDGYSDCPDVTVCRCRNCGAGAHKAFWNRRTPAVDFETLAAEIEAGNLSDDTVRAAAIVRAKGAK